MNAPTSSSALDVIEHLAEPEAGLREIHKALAPGGRLIASTGQRRLHRRARDAHSRNFNYGKKGILDLTHKRLFTVRSFCRLLEDEGFRIDRIRGFGPPVADMVGKSLMLRCVDRVASWLARLWKRMFAYQFVVEATRLDALDDVLDRTVS